MGLLGTLLGRGSAATDVGKITEQINGIVDTITIIIYSLASFGLTLFAIYVGYKMVRAEDDGKRKEAKQQLIYSIVGLIGCVALITMFALIIPLSLTLGKEGLGTSSAVDKLAGQVLTTLQGVMSILVKVLALGASVLAMFVGWKLMSAEDEGKRKQAKTQLIYSIVGIVGVVMINIIGDAALTAVKAAMK